MCKKLSLVLLLALSLVPVWSQESPFILTPEQRADILTTLDDLQNSLQTLEANYESYKTTILELESNLNRVKQDLTQAIEDLKNSNASLETVSQKLTEANLALKESEKSFRNYQDTVMIEKIITALVALLVGGVIGWCL